MAEPIQQALNGNEIAAIVTAISPDRFKTYLTAAGHNQERALRLYLWNARLGEAFHMPIQAVEVALRNNVNLALSNVYTSNWWECKNLYDLLDEERKADLTIVFRRIRNRELELCTGQVVAGLSFGFWVGMLQGRYNPPIWGGQLRTAFPSFPANRARKSLHDRVRKVATLRNRISHHEPLIGRDNLFRFFESYDAAGMDLSGEGSLDQTSLPRFSDRPRTALRPDAIRADAALFALIVDAKDDAAARFYRHHGFQAFSGRAARLFLPVTTARRVVEG